jgi:hypothetical protein
MRHQLRMGTHSGFGLDGYIGKKMEKKWGRTPISVFRKKWGRTPVSVLMDTLEYRPHSRRPEIHHGVGALRSGRKSY